MSEIFANLRNERLFADSLIGHAWALRNKSKRKNSPVRHSTGAHGNQYSNLFADGNDTTPQKRFSIVSMFSGCGGMDLGFHGDFTFLGRKYDPLPFDVIWANELNPTACRTYRKNLGVEIKCEDVWTAIETIPQQVDILIGGFPCQDVSVNGKRQGVNGMRTGLYKAMIEGIKRAKPKVFIAENVKGLLMKDNQSRLIRSLRIATASDIPLRATSALRNEVR
jgi:DNA (cytosine-5)-methyltransferase 1